MVQKRPRTVPEGPRSAPEGSEMSRNDPRRSRKVLEASGRFQKFSGSTAHYPTPLALGASHLGCPGRPGGGGAPRGGNPPPGGNTKTQIWQVSGGKVWEGLGGLGVQVGLPTPLIAPQGPPGQLYNEGRGWGRSTHQTPSPMRHPPSL